MSSDYDNPFGMSEQEFEYRAMNPQDPMYMGDKYSKPYGVNDPYNPGYIPKKGSSKKSGQKYQKNPYADELDKIAGMPLWLFIVLCSILLGLFTVWLIWLFDKRLPF